MRYGRTASWFVLASLFPLAAMAGSIDSPGTLPSAGSGMYTLQGLYEYLLSGTEASISVTFQEPVAGPGDTGKTLKEIYDEIKAEFNACDVTADKVLDSVTFFSTDPANWGPRVGTLAAQTPVNTTVSQSAGYYNTFDLSAVDADLTSANIKGTSTIFGVPGKNEVVDTAEATNPAGAGDVLSGKVAYVNGVQVTGTMPTQTLSDASKTVAAGYYGATTLDAVDADLTSANIKAASTIFGVTGTVIPASGAATDADVLSGVTYSNAGGASTGKMPTQTLSDASKTVAAGYYGATTLDAVDADLTSANIRSDVEVFGVTGSYNGVECSGTLSALGRWCDNGNGTVTDMNSGLVWLQNAGCIGLKKWIDTATWDDANTAATVLYDGSTAFGAGDCNLSDGSAAGEWRLPTKSELVELTTGTEYVRGSSPYEFSNVQSSSYWSSTTSAFNTFHAWDVYMSNGYVSSTGKPYTNYVWPVRGGQ